MKDGSSVLQVVVCCCMRNAPQVKAVQKVNLITKQAKVHLNNEKSGINEFEVWCLEKQGKPKEKTEHIL